MSSIPRLLRGMIDDAAVFPPGNAPLPYAVPGHRGHRAAWYSDLVGPLLVPASHIGELVVLAEDLEVGLIGDADLTGLDKALTATVTVRQVEVPVAKRGEDPLPGLRTLTSWASGRPFEVYAEIPLTWGCLAALDELATSGAPVSAKFRTGGLAAELFPTPQDLAAVIVACAERELRFKLTAGLHHAVRHTDPATGFTHHGYLNVLAGSLMAADGGGASAVTQLLSETAAGPLVAAARPALRRDRPLWTGFGSCSIGEPLEDMTALGLLEDGR